MVSWIVVTGGVLSGLGKGVAVASIGNLLKEYNVTPIKCDGYLNVDPGTMNPIEHGEVFVLDDGAEVDMDFGHYERFLGVSAKKSWNLTMGRVYEEIRNKERKGDFLGKTVQLIPHVTDLIKDWWRQVAQEEQSDIVLVEVGGTVGDIENELYLEAARQLRDDGEKVLYMHLTYVPLLANVNEQKSKPTQQSIALLRSRGIQPDIILARSQDALNAGIREKLSVMCGVPKKRIISAVDVESVYKIPLSFEKEGLAQVLEEFGFRTQIAEDWKNMLEKMNDKELTVAICGKYTQLEDSYASVVEALKHAATQQNATVIIKWFETSNEQELSELESVDAVIVPGGFGSRGVEGKINIIRYCRENNIPFLGICYGLQLAVVEHARLLGLDANTAEADPNTKNPVIAILPEQQQITDKGATMRLGAYPAILKEGSIIAELYGSTKVSERHRHRYEVNPEYYEQLETKGLVFSGRSDKGSLVEFIERDDHPYFVATQAHPELKSTPTHPAPLFTGLIQAALRDK